MAYHTLLALDFDETLALTYQFAVPVWDTFLADWLVQHGHFTTPAAARASMHNFDNPYGCGPTYMAKQFGRNKAWIEGFYQAVSPFILAANIQGNLRIHPQLKAELERLQTGGYFPLIISQGHRDFILPMLQHLGLAHIFPATQVIDRAHKRLEPHGYQLAKYLTNHLHLKHFIMADDSAYNFAHAKAEGFTSVLIKPEASTTELTSADHHFPDLLSYLKTLS